MNQNTKIAFSDSEGYKYNSFFSSVMSGHKPYRFGTNNKYTIENIKLWIKLNSKPFTLLSDKYVNSQEKLLFKCNVCGYKFLSTWGHIFSGRGCRNCQYINVGKLNSTPSKERNLLVIYPQLCEEWDYAKNKYLPEQYMPSSNKKVFWKCSRCRNEWESSINHRVHMKSGCPQCSYSKGEIEIAKMLQNNNIEFKQEYKFDDCKNQKRLRFDFYLPGKNTCIEYDGEEHFHPVRFGGMPESKANDNFIRQQNRDSIKTQYCLKNNIKLIRIPYYKKEYLQDIILQSII